MPWFSYDGTVDIGLSLRDQVAQLVLEDSGSNRPGPAERESALHKLIESIEANYTEQLALYPNGNAVAVWNRFGASNSYDIWASRYTVGSGWETPWTVNTTLNNSSQPAVVVDSAGAATAAWTQSYSIYARGF